MLSKSDHSVSDGQSKETDYSFPDKTGRSWLGWSYFFCLLQALCLLMARINKKGLTPKSVFLGGRPCGFPVVHDGHGKTVIQSYITPERERERERERESTRHGFRILHVSFFASVIISSNI
jgi:hypothetical protein